MSDSCISNSDKGGAASISTSQPGNRSQHYVVLHAGLCGHSHDTRSFAQHLRTAAATSKNNGNNIIVLQPKVNDPFFSKAALRLIGRNPTCDGVANCGSRIATYIRSEVPPGSTLSVIGHSMGGLILREAMRELWIQERGWCTTVQFHAYISVCTPHAGVSTAGMPWVAEKYFSQSIADMGYADTSTLPKLSDAEGLRSLETFQHLLLYGGIGDPVVPFTSAVLGLCSEEGAPKTANSPKRQIQVLTMPGQGTAEGIAVAAGKGSNSAQTTVRSNAVGPLLLLPWQRHPLKCPVGSNPHFVTAGWSSAATPLLDHIAEHILTANI